MKEVVLKVESIFEPTSGVFRLELRCNQPLEIRGGQFLNLEVPDSSLILRRPFCIYSYKNNCITIYFAVVGKGTAALSCAKIGQELRAIVPLGNGFDITPYKRIGLLGGGMGAAALHMVAQMNPQKEFYAYLGFLNKSRVLFEEDFKRCCKGVQIFTTEGDYGIRGFPTQGIVEGRQDIEAVLVCGPSGLVRALQGIAELRDKPVYVSLEQRMACGVGACLVCTCAQSDGVNRRVCADGPVFELKRIGLFS